MPEQARSVERPSEPQANGLTALLERLRSSAVWISRCTTCCPLMPIRRPRSDGGGIKWRPFRAATLQSYRLTLRQETAVFANTFPAPKTKALVRADVNWLIEQTLLVTSTHNSYSYSKKNSHLTASNDSVSYGGYPPNFGSL
jgi:hypothetical protein